MSRPIVLVTGGRDYSDVAAVERALSALRPGLLIEGGANGADALARTWAAQHGVQPLRADALWGFHRKAAGPIRNSAMVRVAALLKAGGAEVIVVAFPGGSGTADCAEKARAAGLDVREVSP